jgi:protein gp37
VSERKETKRQEDTEMSGKSAIEWTEMTWNPTTGCSRVTAGCDHCYAFAQHDMRHAAYQRTNGVYADGRRMPVQYAQPFSTVQLLPERLEQPLHIKAPSLIFVDSMSDLFHSQVPDEYIKRVFAVMERAHWHTFQVLTKRVGRLRRMAQQLDWPDNVWMGVSIERDELMPRTDALRAVPAAVRFLSCEPLLGPLPSLTLEGIGWVIVGGKAAPTRDPCKGNGSSTCETAVWRRRYPFSSNNGADALRKRGGVCSMDAPGTSFPSCDHRAIEAKRADRQRARQAERPAYACPACR